MRRTTFLTIVLGLAAGACKSESSSEPQKKAADEPPRKLAGVFPDRFQCDSIATPDALAPVLGGAVRKLDTPSSVPRGLAKPCTYEVATTPQPEYWTFDFDCRDNMKETADALFTQYAKTSTELVAQFNVSSDAGPEPGMPKPDAAVRDPDAGPEPVRRAPELAGEVPVGARGLDHHGQGLLFIDDDAPCYVRVVGPDKDKRLALAQLVAKNLTFDNAPMSPRAAK